MNKILKIFLLLMILSLSLISKVFPQDERYIDKILNANKHSNSFSSKTSTKKINTLFSASSAAYMYDINSDGIYEILETSKEDGLDILRIYDSVYNLKFEYPLLGLADNPGIKKIKLVNLSKTVNALVIYFFEGTSFRMPIKSSSLRLYFISFNSLDLSNFTPTKGPTINYEFFSHQDRYITSNYQILIEDLDKDNVKDILIKNGGLSILYQYKNGRIVSVN